MAEWIDLIVRKKEGEILESEEIVEFVKAVQREEVPVEQASAFLMAAVLNGLDEDETCVMARALAESGQTLRFTEAAHACVDIGDTGGVGCSAMLVALPIAAVFECRLPVIAERSLAGYGGLLDRFESIPGFRADFGMNEFSESVRSIGMAVIGQNRELAPAETRLNQIRAATGSMGGIGMTVASLMARKAVVGVRGLVIDVACGSGALAKTLADAQNLADYAVQVGESLNISVTGLISDRNQPVGSVIGDTLEMGEAIRVLKGEGPESVKEMAVNMAASLLMVARLVTDHAHGHQRALDALADGRALAKFKDFVSNQGGDTLVLDNPALLPRGQGTRDIITQRSGYVKAIDCACLATSWACLGGTRVHRGDATDHRVGLTLLKKIGDKIEKGDVLATLHTSEKSKVDPAIEAAEEAFMISPVAPEKKRLVVENFGRHR
jgi:pyrimidine-nucleoside phosphorylase